MQNKKKANDDAFIFLNNELVTKIATNIDDLSFNVSPVDGSITGLYSVNKDNFL
jgi:hypothetical protein